MRDWWHRLRTMPDRERARVLALVLGAIIVGVLYALGGISLYLRASFLSPTATSASAPGQGVTLTPLSPLIIITPTRAVTPTLYPTITNTPDESVVSDRLVTEVPTETPFPSPTAQPSHTPEPAGDARAPTEEAPISGEDGNPIVPARPGR